MFAYRLWTGVLTFNPMNGAQIKFRGTVKKYLGLWGCIYHCRKVVCLCHLNVTGIGHWTCGVFVT